MLKKVVEVFKLGPEEFPGFLDVDGFKEILFQTLSFFHMCSFLALECRSVMPSVCSFFYNLFSYYKTLQAKGQFENAKIKNSS